MNDVTTPRPCNHCKKGHCTIPLSVSTQATLGPAQGPSTPIKPSTGVTITQLQVNKLWKYRTDLIGPHIMTEQIRLLRAKKGMSSLNKRHLY